MSIIKVIVDGVVKSVHIRRPLRKVAAVNRGRRRQCEPCLSSETGSWAPAPGPPQGGVSVRAADTHAQMGQQLTSQATAGNGTALDLGLEDAGGILVRTDAARAWVQGLALQLRTQAG